RPAAVAPPHRLGLRRVAAVERGDPEARLERRAHVRVGDVAAADETGLEGHARALLGEGRGFALRALFRERARQDHEAMAEARRSTGSEREVQRLLAVAEDALPER